MLDTLPILLLQEILATVGLRLLTLLPNVVFLHSSYHLRRNVLLVMITVTWTLQGFAQG